ncbi:MAG: DNA-binding protein WhiA, partial [Lachnospiraceae bacterium]|nr:DNA-binding protein WhiA [Lachnospiraceae bacterium]
MSFSTEIKNELSELQNNARHCRIAELSALLASCAVNVPEAGISEPLLIRTDSFYAARKCFTLIRKSFNIICNVSVRRNKKSSSGSIYTIRCTSLKESRDLLTACGIKRADRTVMTPEGTFKSKVLRSACCKRSYLRGAFLGMGTISDPKTAYDFEYNCPDDAKAAQILKLMEAFDIAGKVTKRKTRRAVYLKDGTQISDMLNVIGAYKALMEFENARIMKDVLNKVNRQLNCDTANVQKTLKAAQKQLDDIQLIRDSASF